MDGLDESLNMYLVSASGDMCMEKTYDKIQTLLNNFIANAMIKICKKDNQEHKANRNQLE